MTEMKKIEIMPENAKHFTSFAEVRRLASNSKKKRKELLEKGVIKEV